MRTAFVTGGEGFVGSYLCDLLEEEGIRALSYDLRSGMDIRDYEQLRTALDIAQPDYVFHLAAQAFVPESTSDVRRGVDTNIVGTLNLLEAVRHTGSRARVLLAGTSEEYGYDNRGILTELAPCRPTTPYGVSKLAAGQLGMTYSRAYGIPVVATRAFNHTGPGHPPIYAVPSFAKRVIEVKKGLREAVIHGNLDSTRNYTDVRDMVAAYRLAIDLDPDVYNICSDNTVKVEKILELMIKLVGGNVPTQLVDSLYRAGSSDFPTPSCQRFTSLTNWRPQYSLEDTLRDTLIYWEHQV